MDKQIKEKIEKLYKEIPELMEKLEFREVSNKIMNLLEDANKYYDEQKPWRKAKEDINSFNNIIFTCSNIIANISNLFEPFMPETTEKIRKILEIEKPTWEYIEAKPHTKLENVEVLFTRM